MHRIAFALLVALLVTGCTFREVKPETALGPPQKYDVLVLGEIKTEKSDWEQYLHHFKLGFTQWLTEKKAFQTVTSDSSAAPPGPVITLSGTITEVDKGSVALRMLVGMGAGQAKIKGVFEIKDATGQTLAKFHGRESFLGGLGMGGIHTVTTEDLMKRFAETVAETTMKWARGEKIDQ